MSLFTALQSSLSSLQTTTAQMQLVSGNISNANTVGYTRKTATLGQSTGGGAQITGYDRVTDSTLTATLNAATSDASKLGAQNTYLQQTESFLGLSSSTGNPPLEDAVSQFSSAWQQLAAAPESNVNQQQVLSTASSLVSQIQHVSSQITGLDRQVSTDIKTTLSTLNSNLTQISDVNQKIALAMSTNQPTGDLEDQRDQLIQKVAQAANVTVMQRPRDQIALYTPGGYMLLDGTTPPTFSYDGTNVTANSDPTKSLNGVLIGGALQAQVDFRATTSPVSTDPATSVIQKLNSQMNALAAAFTTSSAGPPETFAHAYANATGQTGEATTFFTGTDAASIAVNANLVNGSQTIKQASANAVVATFNDSSKTFTADGLNLQNGSYSMLTSTILSNFQEAASTISALNTTASGQQSYLQQSLSNTTGVNVDTETVSLATLQNTYAASAHVISVINNMFATLFGISAA